MKKLSPTAQAKEYHHQATEKFEFANLAEPWTEKEDAYREAFRLMSLAYEEQKGAKLLAMLDRLRLWGQKKGRQQIILRRLEFLKQIAARIGTEKNEAVAAAALDYEPGKVRKLWGASGENARAKILNSLRNK